MVMFDRRSSSLIYTFDQNMIQSEKLCSLHCNQSGNHCLAVMKPRSSSKHGISCQAYNKRKH